MTNLPQKITIIGVGFIGGSIALGLKSRLGEKITIVGLCSSPQKARLLKSRGMVDKVINKLEDIPKNSDLIIICTPLGKIVEIIEKLASRTLIKGIVIDVGSTKESICQKAWKFSSSFSFIGTHPMAGKEVSGLEFADPNLFVNKPWIVCPARSIDKKYLLEVSDLIKLLGGRIMLMNPSYHDQIIVWGSHIFLVLTSIMISLASQQKHWPEIAKVASTGFRDTTRLASHNPEMKADIIALNRKNITEALNKTKTEIDNFLKLLTAGNNETILSYFRRSKIIRDNWLNLFFG